MWENWKLRWVDDNTWEKVWNIRWTISWENNEITPELRKILDDLLEKISNLSLQEDNILEGTLDIIQNVADVRNQWTFNTHYQELLNNISEEINNVIDKRRYILYIWKRIENIDVNYKTWIPTESQKREISALETRIWEAQEKYPNDPNFISILSRLKLRLDKLFTV